MYIVKYAQIVPGETTHATLHEAVEQYHALINNGHFRAVSIEVQETRELTTEEIATASKDRKRSGTNLQTSKDEQADGVGD